jgi:hypothetical protein
VGKYFVRPPLPPRSAFFLSQVARRYKTFYGRNLLGGIMLGVGMLGVAYIYIYIYIYIYAEFSYAEYSIILFIC